jgi:hypothetical protein
MGGTFLRPPGTKKSKAADKSKRKNKGTDSVMTVEATTASAVAESKENGLKILSAIEDMKLQQGMYYKMQGMYFKFNMLSRQGKHHEAEKFMEEMDRSIAAVAAATAVAPVLVAPVSVATTTAAASRIPRTIGSSRRDTVVETDSSDDDDDKPVTANLKDDKKYESDSDEEDSDHSSQDGSGGDPNPRRNKNVPAV